MNTTNGAENMSETTHEMLEKEVASLVDTLETLIGYTEYGYEFTEDDWENLRGFGIVGEDDELDDMGNDLLREACEEYLREMPLEIVEHASRSAGDEWVYTHAVIVFGTGGPHTELNTADGCIHGYWGGEHVTKFIGSGEWEAFYGLGE